MEHKVEALRLLLECYFKTSETTKQWEIANRIKDVVSSICKEAKVSDDK